MAKQRFEFDDGRSSKYWQISLRGKSHTVQYGRIGAAGQQKTKSFATKEDAKKDAEKLIAQKKKKGYSAVAVERKATPGRKHKIPSAIRYRAKNSLGSDSVDDAWDRIEAWLTLNLPLTRKSLRRPAKVQEIKAFEKAAGFELPEDLKRSYRRHDGQDEVSAGVIFGLPLVPLETLQSFWQDYRRYEKSKQKKYDFDDDATCFPVGFVQPVYRSDGWLPVSHDFSGNSIVVDVSPGELGTEGQVLISDRDGFHPVLALSWAQFLTDVADEMERGNWMIKNHGSGEDIEFNLRVPENSHFHDVGANWSRCKLGLRRLADENQAIWKRRTLTK